MRVNLLKINIMEKAFFKMNTYFALAKEQEVGGLLETETKKNVITIKDFVLLEQQVSGGDFVLETEDLNKFSKELFMKNPSKMKSYRGWAHKHPILGFSGQDDNTFKRLGKIFKGSIVGLVLQSNGELLCRVDMFSSKTQARLDTTTYTIIKEEFNRKKIKKQCKKEFKRKVKERDYSNIPIHKGDYYKGDYYSSYPCAKTEKDDWWKDYDDDIWALGKKFDDRMIKTSEKDNKNTQIITKDFSYPKRTLKQELETDINDRLRLEHKWDMEKVLLCRKNNDCETCPLVCYCLDFEETHRETIEENYKKKETMSIYKEFEGLWGYYD